MYTKPNHRTLSNSPRFHLDLQQQFTPTAQSPRVNSPKLSFLHHARHLSHNNVLNTQTSDSGRLHTEPAYSTLKEVKSYEDSSLHKIPSQVKKFKDFFHQNLSHLSERSLKNINYDTLDHLSYYLQNPGSHRLPIESLGRVQTETIPSDTRIIQQLTYSTPREGFYRPEEKLIDSSQKKRPVMKSRELKKSPNGKGDKFSSPESIKSIYRKKTFSLVSQEILSENQKEPKEFTKQLKGFSLVKEDKTVAEVIGVLGSSRITRRQRGKTVKENARVLFIEEKREKEDFNRKPSREVKEIKSAKLVRGNDENKGKEGKIEEFNSAKNPKLLENGNQTYEFERKNSESSQKINNSSMTNVQRSIEAGEEFNRKKQTSSPSINEYPKSLAAIARKLKKTSSVANGLKKSERVCVTETSEVQTTKLLPETVILASTNDTFTKTIDFGKEAKTQPSIKNLSMMSSKSTKSARALAHQLTNRPYLPRKELKASGQLTERLSSSPEEAPQTLTIVALKVKNLKTSQNFKSFRNSPNKSDSNRSYRKSNHSLEDTDRTQQGNVSRVSKAGSKGESKSPKEAEISKSFLKAQEEEKKKLLKFDFKKKSIKLIKPKPFPARRNSVQYKGQGEAYSNDFIIAIDNAIKTISSSLYGGSLMRNPGSMSKINYKDYKGFQRKLSEQTGISQFEEFLKQDFDDDGSGALKRGLTSDIDRLTKKNTLESEMASLNRMLTRTSSVDQNGGVVELKRNMITKPYPIKNWVITVNINPPIEEASPRMEDSVFPYPTVTNTNEGSEPRIEIHASSDELLMNPVTSSTNMPSVSSIGKSKQYRFELHSRQPTEEFFIEEEKQMFEDIAFSEDMALDQSFRKKTETLFTYEGLEIGKLDDLCSRALVARNKINFFGFLEKLIINPVNHKGHREYLETYTIEEPKKSALANSGGLFRHHPKIRDIIFRFLEEYNLQQDLILRSIIRMEARSRSELDFIEDEVLENTKLVNKESVKTGLFQMNTNPQRTCPVTGLDSKPILLSLDLKTLQQMKDLQTLFRTHTVCSDHFSSYSTDNYNKINRIIAGMDNENHDYMREIMIKIYRRAFYGSFEGKVIIDEPKLEIKFEELDKLRTQLLTLEKNSRRRPSHLRSKDESPVMITEPESPAKSLKKKKSMGRSKAAALLRKATNKISKSKIINETEEKDYSEDKEPFKRGVHLRPAPRRYSKTTIKPFVSTIAKEQQPGLEKFKTAQMEIHSESKKNSISINNGLTETALETLPEPLVNSKGRTITLASEDDTTETSNQLQIPSRNFTSSQPKFMTSFLSGKDDKSKIFIEKLRAGKNMFTASNTLNSSTHKSLSPHSDSNAGITRSNTNNNVNTNTNININTNANTNAKTVTKLPSYTTLVPPDFKDFKSERSSPSNKGDQKEGDKVLLKIPSMQQIARTIISKNAFVNKLRDPPTVKIRRDKDKDPIRRILIENGPKTALFYAIHHRKFQEVEEILGLYPWEVINIRDEQENTLLILAVQGGTKDIVNLLLQRKKIDINAQNVEGNTALHYALQIGYDSIADLLIANGAKQSIMNNRGKTAWEMVDR